MSLKQSLKICLSIFLLASCSDSKEDTIGKWDDNIKLSAKSATLKAVEDSVSIITKGSWWWVDGISFDGDNYSYYNSDEVDIESDSYSIKEDGFVVERRDKHELFIKLEENKTESERVLSISLQAGNYFDYVSIKQSAN